jgi:hypothetical protein
MKAQSDSFSGKRAKNFLSTVVLLIHRLFDEHPKLLEERAKSDFLRVHQIWYKIIVSQILKQVAVPQKGPGIPPTILNWVAPQNIRISGP